MHGLIFAVIGLFVSVVSLRVARVRPFFWLGLIFILYGLIKMYLMKRKRTAKAKKK